METLTRRQQQILEFIKGTQERVGTAPSLREIAGHFGFSSMNAAADHVRALRRKGALQGPSHRARSIQPVSLMATHRKPVFDIPIYGTIPAGFAAEPIGR